MLQHQFQPSRSPFARLVGALVLLAGFAISLFFGFVLLLVILGALLILGLALYLRVWWIKRQMAGQPPPGPASPRGGVTLEGEYTREDREKR